MSQPEKYTYIFQNNTKNIAAFFLRFKLSFIRKFNKLEKYSKIYKL